MRSRLSQVTDKICFCYPGLGQDLQQGHQPGSGNSFLQLLFHPGNPDLYPYLSCVTEAINLPVPGLLTQVHRDLILCRKMYVHNPWLGSTVLAAGSLLSATLTDRTGVKGVGEGF